MCTRDGKVSRKWSIIEGRSDVNCGVQGLEPLDEGLDFRAGEQELICFGTNADYVTFSMDLSAC
jgi:hypothetical protein